MSNNYTIISKESDFQKLLSKLKEKGIELPLLSFDNSSSSDTLNSLKTHITDYGEYINYCIFRTFALLIDSIRNNSSLSNVHKNSSILFLKDLMYHEEFRNHLITSALYTARYLTSNSYMIMHQYLYYQSYSTNQYLYYQSYSTNKICFWDKDHINDFTRTDDKENNGLIVRKPNKILKMGRTAADKSFKDAVNLIAEQVPNSQYKNLFDIESLTNPNRSLIRLFLPTYALIINRYIENRDKKTEQKEKEKKTFEKSTHSKREPLPDFQVYIPDKLQDIGIKSDPKLLSKLDQEIKTTLDRFETEYNRMANLIASDPFYTSSAANQCLYFYRLNRAFPMQFFLTVFNPDLPYLFNLDYVKAMISIPDNYTRCIFHQYIHYFFGKMDLINDVIDTIFPTIEEVFFAYIAIRYGLNYQLLDNDLTEYLNEHTSSAHIFNASMPQPAPDKRTMECIPAYYQFIHSNDSFIDFHFCEAWDRFLNNEFSYTYYNHPLYALYLFDKSICVDQQNTIKTYSKSEIDFKQYDMIMGNVSWRDVGEDILKANRIIEAKEPIDSEDKFTIMAARIINELFQ